MEETLKSTFCSLPIQLSRRGSISLVSFRRHLSTKWSALAKRGSSTSLAFVVDIGPRSSEENACEVELLLCKKSVVVSTLRGKPSDPIGPSRSLSIDVIPSFRLTNLAPMIRTCVCSTQASSSTTANPSHRRRHSISSANNAVNGKPC